MPCIYVETCRLKDILAALPELPPHNWLITDLECYDTAGWDGCEKWNQSELFLTDEELRRDVNLRNMQIIWGVFSAIPAEYTQEDIYGYSLPESENPYYMSNRIVPQHSLAILELYVDDGWFTFVSSHSSTLLEPLYNLPYKTRDEEADNQKMNAQLRRIQNALRKEIPDVSPEVANEVQWKVWHTLFKCSNRSVEDRKLLATIMNEYHLQIQPGHSYTTTFWDPYAQE
ncbi:MAG: hypothetical protein IJX37_08765 [Oscillospiraceae bacterium]|nr:hypothetical protein [Oscillospiraceae bacterium]